MEANFIEIGRKRRNKDLPAYIPKIYDPLVQQPSVNVPAGALRPTPCATCATPHPL